MRATVALLAAFLSACSLAPQTASGPAAPTPEDLLQRGEDSYRAGRYDAAIADLTAATDQLFTPEQIRDAASTRIEPLPKFETAIIYLAMSYAKLGRDAAARDAIQRLVAIEEIAPVYATLPLTTDVGEFEQVVQRVAPGVALPPNAALAELQTVPLPPVRPVETASAPPAAPEPQPAPAPQPVPAPQPAEPQPTPVAQATPPPTVVPEPASVPEAVPQPVLIGTVAEALRRAGTFATSGDLDLARQTYEQVLDTGSPSRETLAAAGTGLYRVGAYAAAVRAFERMQPFHRGEEDLRYYNAVSLFETAHYEEAKKELACALPFLEATGSVERYREKIEQMGSQTAAR